MLRLTNLQVVGHVSQRTTAIQFQQFPKHKHLIDFTAKLVKKAIHTECTPELAQRAIKGYRRSSGEDIAAEKDFQKTDQPQHTVVRDIHYRRALQVCEKLFRPSRRLKPIAFPDLRYYPWTLNVSAEAPYTTRQHWRDYLRKKQSEKKINDNRPTFQNLYDEIFHDNRSHIHSIKFGLYPFWDKETGLPIPYQHTTLHARAHLVAAEKDDKIRAVFGVPKLLLMAENMFIWNLQKEYLNNKVQSPMLWGFETFKGGWMKLWHRLSGKQKNSVLSADWSGFDHRALHEVMDDVHYMWRSWYDFDQGYEPSMSADHDYSDSKTEEWKIQNLWDWMTYSVKHTPILGPSSTLYKWRFNGIASGFQQTQLIDSFVNAIYLLTCLSSLGINIMADDFTLHVQGDDSLCTFAEHVFEQYGRTFLIRLADEALRRFNAVLSPDKTSWGSSLNDVEVLSYRNISGVSYRDPAELLAKLLYPERVRTLGATASAALGVAVSAMGSSRQVYNTCRNVFDFIVNDLGVQPESDNFMKQHINVHKGALEEILVQRAVRFPSFEDTLNNNFDYSVRTEKDKQTLWPTKPTGNEFHFLLD